MGSMATHLVHAGESPAAQPIPAAIAGRAGHEVTVLAVVGPPTAPGCGHMRVPFGAGYRLLGAWQQTSPTTLGPTPTTAALWWVTGHTLPPVDAADHAWLAPFTPGCDHAPAFYVDHAVSVNAWLGQMVNALLAGPGRGRAPTRTTDPVHQRGWPPICDTGNDPRPFIRGAP
jgi:hypothetical protein